MDSLDKSQIAIKIIRENYYLTLATVTKDKKPWSTPLYFVKDAHFNLYFVSPRNTTHAENIRREGEGFITIFDSHAKEGEGTGVYIKAMLEEFNEVHKIKNILLLMYQDKQKKRNADEFMNDAKRRIYKATPQTVWINDAIEEKGLYLDYKIEVKLI